MALDLLTRSRRSGCLGLGLGLSLGKGLGHGLGRGLGLGLVQCRCEGRCGSGSSEEVEEVWLRCQVRNVMHT